MKFIVDKLPNNIKDCIFSEWRTYPPIMEEAGYYKCIKCFKSVDCSYKIANIINEINYGRIIFDLITGIKTDTAFKINNTRIIYSV